MENFREWLSDNLRYIALIAGIVVVLIGLFFGVKYVSAKISGHGDEEKFATDSVVSVEEEAIEVSVAESAVSEAELVAVEPETASVVPDTESEEESEETEETEIENPLALDAVPEVSDVMHRYYTALNNKDVDTVRGLADILSDEEAESIEANTTSYGDLQIFTKDGPAENSYVVYTRYNYRDEGQIVAYPGLSQTLVSMNGEGVYKLIYSEYDQTTSDYIDAMSEDSDVQKLIEEVQNAYDSAVAEEAAAQEQAAKAAAEAEAAAKAAQETGVVNEDGEWTSVILSDCFVRSGPGYDYGILGQVGTGMSVTVIGGEQKGWWHIRTDNIEGYVGRRFVQH